MDAPFNYDKGEYSKGQVTKKGYIRTSRNGRRVMQHRLVVERKLGRQLTADEAVHHKNENKADNFEDNLELMAHGQHSSHHNAKQRQVGDCAVFGCGRGKWCKHLCKRHYMQFLTRGSLNGVLLVF
jgi:hypothetical protein